MKKTKEPTIFQIVVSCVISVILGWMVYTGLDALINIMILKTLHTYWAKPVLICSTVAVCAIVVGIVWLTRALAYKMANTNEEASDI